MRIAIVGPGAIGCLFAAMLSRAGSEVWLVDRNPERARLLTRRGLFVSGVTEEFHAAVRATTVPEEVGGADLAIIAVKTYDTGTAARAAQAALREEGLALTLQNGVGNVEVLQATLGEGRVLGAATSQGATLIAPGQVHHAGRGTTVVGEPSGELTERVIAIRGILTNADLSAEVTTDLAGALWGKLIVNAGINAVAAIAQVRNGGIMESGHLRQVMRSAVLEACEVAQKKQIRLPFADMVGHTEEVCQRTANNLNSMLQDVHRQRRTEIDAINGEVVRQGEALGVPVPVNSLLVSLVHGLEETYAARRAR
jgi:2-dehydropantoate 2-reductase